MPPAPVLDIAQFLSFNSSCDAEEVPCVIELSFTDRLPFCSFYFGRRWFSDCLIICFFMVASSALTFVSRLVHFDRAVGVS
jgi:hypothetical protein